MISLLVSLILSITVAQAEDCKNRIILLPQTHPSILGGKLEVAPENYELTAWSQYHIATWLASNRKLPVFSEQVSTDQTMSTARPEFKKVATSIQKMFPNGLPTYDMLSMQQKHVIAKAGGDAISLILGNTAKLHRVVESDKVMDSLIGKVSDWAKKNPNARTYPPEISNIIFSVRENLALDQINNFFRQNPSQKDVVLIFGSDHSPNFRWHPEKFPGQCIVVPEEFQSANTSPYALPSFGYGGYGVYPQQQGSGVR